MGLNDEIPLFVDTNLDTRFALSASQDISVRDLKDKLGMEHFSCFPHLGKIKVHGLMIKKKSFFYHLSDSMAIKYVFEGVSQTCLLHLNASWVQNMPDERVHPLNGETESTSDLGFRIEHQPNHFNNIDECGKVKLNEKSTLLEHPFDGKENENYMEKSSISSQTISVTGIISRFFSGLDEVDSYCCQPELMRETERVHDNELTGSKVRGLASESDHMNDKRTVESDTDTRCSFAKQVEDTTAEREKVAKKVKKKPIRSRKLVNRKPFRGTPHISSNTCTETPSCKECNHQVGRRLVQAANSMTTSRNEKMSAAMFLSRCRNLATPDSALDVRSIAFDIDEFVD